MNCCRQKSKQSEVSQSPFMFSCEVDDGFRTINKRITHCNRNFRSKLSRHNGGVHLLRNLLFIKNLKRSQPITESGRVSASVITRGCFVQSTVTMTDRQHFKYLCRFVINHGLVSVPKAPPEL